MIYAEVVLPIPINKGFHYKVPDHIAENVKKGSTLLVPFGKQNRKIAAYCININSSIPPSIENKLKFVISVIKNVPLISNDIFELARFISSYYLCSLGETLHAILPAGVRSATGTKRQLFVEPAYKGLELDSLMTELKEKNFKWYKVLELLEFAKEPILASECATKLKISMSPIKTLIKKGYLTSSLMEQGNDEFAIRKIEQTPFHSLSPKQEEAFNKIKSGIDNKQNTTYLLYGITGSGKTEIYLRIINEVIKQGKQAIVLVPEIALTPQTIVKFREKFDNIAIMHSHLSGGIRASYWHAIKEGTANVIIGARSAIFAPVKNLGVVIIDEEHEPSYKQDNIPRYNARKVAQKLAKIHNAITILGSATPSLESYYQAIENNYERIDLDERIGGGVLPPVKIVDMTNEFGKQGGIPVLSPFLIEKIKETTKRGEQVMLLLNRRGFTTLLKCKSCKNIIKCARCEIALTFHKADNKGVCHYCNRYYDVNKCPYCDSHQIMKTGYGTEKIESILRKIFPNLNIDRMDSDSMKTRKTFYQTIDNLVSGKTNILLGTQMIAKGFDIPNVTLVGVVSADIGLYIKDFRSAERTFQLITQVAGRAGRSEKGGLVVVQTFHPDHYSIKFAQHHDYSGFVKKELEMRRSLGYPPYSIILRILFKHKSEEFLSEKLNKLIPKLKQYIEYNKIKLFLPTRAPIHKIKSKFRWHLIARSTSHGVLKEFARFVSKNSGIPHSATTYDIEPFNMI